MKTAGPCSGEADHPRSMGEGCRAMQRGGGEADHPWSMGEGYRAVDPWSMGEGYMVIDPWSMGEGSLFLSAHFHICCTQSTVIINLQGLKRLFTSYST